MRMGPFVGPGLSSGKGQPALAGLKEAGMKHDDLRNVHHHHSNIIQVFSAGLMLATTSWFYCFQPGNRCGRDP